VEVDKRDNRAAPALRGTNYGGKKLYLAGPLFNFPFPSIPHTLIVETRRFASSQCLTM
jgi:hypothetical protein